MKIKTRGSNRLEIDTGICVGNFVGSIDAKISKNRTDTATIILTKSELKKLYDWISKQLERKEK